MAKLIILSIILFMVLVPLALVGRPDGRRTLRTIQILTFLAVCVWALMCRRWYPELVPAE